MAQMAHSTNTKSGSPPVAGFFRTVGRYRWTELFLLIIPSAILLLEMAQLLIINSTDQTTGVKGITIQNLPIGDGLTPILGFIGVLFAVHLVMNIFFRKADQFLLPITGLLTGMGILMMTRLGPAPYVNIPNLGSRQLLWAILAIALSIIVLVVVRKTSMLSRYKYIWALVSIAMISPSVFQGVQSLATDAPTRDTLGVGGFSLQPSEFFKISLVIFFAAYLNDNRDMLAQGYFRLGGLRLPPLRQLGPLILMLFLALLIFLVVRELGLALLIYGIFLSMTYLANGKISYVLVNLGLFFVLGFIGYTLFSYVKARFTAVGINMTTAWTTQDETIYQSGGEQIVQGLIALSSGGLIGAGLGLGSPFYTPVSYSDMVFTSFGEEFGLIGMFAIIGLYLLLVYRGFKIAAEASDPFDKLLAAGLTCIFAIQTFVVAMCNMKFMPLTGIPLPFLSNGGSALLGNFIDVGLLLRISYNTAIEREGA
ncbi:MAG TPA: FtsW/RodA/SpoVE family cell cycle protein [Dictyobacter sp.]|nr:FtsW/RodA/SpoVE family cell cycle protein [Dictyobacter sp.]